MNVTFLALSVILLVGGITALVFIKFRLPSLAAFVLTGFLLSVPLPFLKGPLVGDASQIHMLSELGIILLMFSVGLEFGVKRLRSLGLRPLVVGLGECGGAGFALWGVAKLCGFNSSESVFIGCALAFSSTTAIMKSLDDENLKAARFSESVMAILIVEDLLAILCLVFLSARTPIAGGQGVNMWEVGMALGLSVGGWWLIGSMAMPRIVRHAHRLGGEEILLFVTIGLSLALSLAFESLHLSAALGAFLAGSILADTREIRRIRNLVHPVRSFFLVLFFATFGMRINLDSLVAQWPFILILSFGLIAGKMLVNSVLSVAIGAELRDAVRIGCALVQAGELTFIISELGVRTGALGEPKVTMLAGVALVTLCTAPFLLRSADMLSAALERVFPKRMRHALQVYSDSMESLAVKPRLAHSVVPFGVMAKAVSFLAFLRGGLRQTYSQVTQLSTTSTLERLALVAL